MGPGIDFDCGTMLLTQTSSFDFESLCRPDVLGLADSMENDQNQWRAGYLLSRGQSINNAPPQPAKYEHAVKGNFCHEVTIQ